MSSSPTNAELEDALRENALSPAEASNETGSVKQHPLREQIELDKHFSRKAQGTNPFAGIASMRIASGGACPTGSGAC